MLFELLDSSLAIPRISRVTAKLMQFRFLGKLRQRSRSGWRTGKQLLELFLNGAVAALDARQLVRTNTAPAQAKWRETAPRRSCQSRLVPQWPRETWVLTPVGIL